MNTQELQQLSEAVQAFKTTHTDLIAQVKKYGEASGDTKAKLDALNDRLTEIETGVKDIQMSAGRKGRDGGSDPNGYSKERKTFIEALRKNWTPEQAQQKGLTLGTDTQGGFLAPSEFVTEIIKNIVEFSPIRSIARVRTTSAPNVKIPKRTTAPAAAWVAELGTRSETQNQAYGMEDIPVHEMYGLTKISRQLLEDAAFDMDAELRGDMAEQFATTEGTAFISGNGIGKPEGILANTSIAYTANGHATVLAADSVLGIQFDIKAGYWANARYVMNRSTLKAVRQLKDDQKQYLWNPGLNGLTQPNIAGFPYTLAEDMPIIGSGNFPILFGDFRRGYTIVDRIVMEWVIDVISSKSTGVVEFSARKRVGGQVVLPEALRSLKMATS